MTSQNGTMATSGAQPQPQPYPQAQAQRKRPRPKIRYSTSSESDGDSDDSDEEPPWWTFTQRGMMKMRARTLGVGRTKSPVEEAGSDVAIPNGHGHGHGTANGEDIGVGTAGGDFEVTATAESGLDTKGREKVARRKTPGSRKSSREKRTQASRDGSTPSSSIKGQSQTRSGSPSRMPFLHSGFPHTALRFPAQFRSSPKGTAVPLSLDTSPRGRMQRSNSAPGSPSVESTSPALPTIATLVSAAAEADPDHPVEILSEADDHPEPREHESEQEHSQLDADHSGPVLPRTRQRPKRQATAPAFSFLKRLSDTGENLTDSEAAMFTSPRVRAKAKLSPTEMIQALDRAEISESPLSQTPDGSATPTRPRARRRQTHRLRINLPPPITQHFANGWPHAGSWQDALYGHYDDVSTSSRQRYPTGTTGSRATATPVGSGVVQSGRSSHDHFPSATANGNGSGNTHANGTGTSLPASRSASVLDARPPFTPRASHDGSPASSPPPAEVERPKRTRTKRRRYRQALVPPTPQGLGFSPTDCDEASQPGAWKEGRVGEHGFDWGAAGRAGLIEEGDELSRAETSGTVPMTMNEKGGSRRGRRRWWLFGPRDNTKRRMIDEDWRKRWRRILFLDARVTIWIRLVNLAVAVTLLGEPTLRAPRIDPLSPTSTILTPPRSFPHDPLRAHQSPSSGNDGLVHHARHRLLLPHRLPCPDGHLPRVLRQTDRTLGSAKQDALGVSRPLLCGVVVIRGLSRYERLHRDAPRVHDRLAMVAIRSQYGLRRTPRRPPAPLLRGEFDRAPKPKLCDKR
jgi:hypothetical protein